MISLLALLTRRSDKYRVHYTFLRNILDQVFLEVRGRLVDSLLLVSEDGWELRNVTLLICLASLRIIVQFSVDSCSIAHRCAKPTLVGFNELTLLPIEITANVLATSLNLPTDSA
jgi:hypothetical protein